jgi:hypothetical protein
MELELAARRVDDVSAALADAGRRIDTIHPSADACGANASGALGDLGRAWDSLISAALFARADEVRALSATASSVVTTAGLAMSGYRAAEDRRGSA